MFGFGPRWLDRLEVCIVLGVIGVILLIEGDATARIIGGVIVVFILGWIIVPARRFIIRVKDRLADPSP